MNAKKILRHMYINPMKVFTFSNFKIGDCKYLEEVLQELIDGNCIEKVELYYKVGIKHNNVRKTVGYRLISDNQPLPKSEGEK